MFNKTYQKACILERDYVASPSFERQRKITSHVDRCGILRPTIGKPWMSPAASAGHLTPPQNQAALSSGCPSVFLSSSVLVCARSANLDSKSKYVPLKARNINVQRHPFDPVNLKGYVILQNGRSCFGYTHFGSGDPASLMDTYRLGGQYLPVGFILRTAFGDAGASVPQVS